MGELMDARPPEASFGEAGKLCVEFGGKILANLEDCALDLIVVVEQPFGGGAAVPIGLGSFLAGSGQPVLHRVEMRPDREGRGVADQSGELMAGGSLVCRPNDGVVLLDIGHDQAWVASGNRRRSFPFWMDV